MGKLSIRHVWVALTVAAGFIGPASSPIGLPDVYWTLLVGHWMVNHGMLLEFDPFTSAPHVSGPILNVQWLADLVFAGLDALGGLNMVITATALVVASTYTLLLAAAVTASGHLRLSCVVVWIAYVLGSSNLSPRPQTLAYPLFALFLLAVMRAEWRKDNRLLWLLPPATALWANLHGSFFTGFVLLGCAAGGRIIATRNLRAARPYGVPGWEQTAAQWAQWASLWSAPELSRALRRALDADRRLKSTTVTDERGIVEQLVLSWAVRAREAA